MILAKKMASDAETDTRQEAQFTPVDEGTPARNDEGLGQRRRHFARYKVELDVSLGSDHNFYVGFVENISAGGVFIATHMLKSVGEVLDISIHLPNSSGTVTGTGEVRWIREYSERSNVPPGMGVRFLTLEPGAQEAIEQFLAHREPIFYDED